MGSMGIDYGRGITNIDLETGIRYGVIHQGDVLQAWCDSSEGQYNNENCPECGHDLRTRKNGDLYCPGCKEFDLETSFDMQSPESFTYYAEGYQCAQTADDPDIFVIKSPYYTWCRFCSPCAPGAGYLTDHLPTIGDGVKAYCFGHDWFESGRAPYPVFSVTTGELVNPR